MLDPISEGPREMHLAGWSDVRGRAAFVTASVILDGRAFRDTPSDFAFWTSSKPGVRPGTFTVDFSEAPVALHVNDPRAVICVK